MKKSILFWTAIVCAAFLAARGILALCGLQFRVGIREPVTLLIAAGAYGFFIFSLTHRTEDPGTIMYEGKECIVETESALWEKYTRYYTYHGWFVCGKDHLYSDAPIESIKLEKQCAEA